jgi:hypothetical protein
MNPGGRRPRPPASRHPGVIAQGLPAANAPRQLLSACRQDQGQIIQP